jgi:hypothetical protein
MNAKAVTKANIKQVRIVRPSSAEMPVKPSLAMTEVNPANSIEIRA